MKPPTASARRYLALWLPFLPTERLRIVAGAPRRMRRRRSRWSKSRTNAQRLCALNRRRPARRDLSPGLSLADARARLPHLAVAQIDRPADAQSWCVWRRVASAIRR